MRMAVDSDEFRRFYEATAASIRGFIVRHGGDPGATDDILQTTYIKFLGSHMATKTESPAARAYLYRIASNAIKDNARSSGRRMRLTEAVARGTPTSIDERDRYTGDPILQDALRLLSPREQKMLWLLYGEEFTHAEVARIMNLSRASIRVLAHRARAKLAKRLMEKGHGK